ncbi:MAG TPA: DUF5715 family protein [Terriglobales bacterium]|nr:DUF5715 family protein [Terriglobales bacterium]
MQKEKQRTLLISFLLTLIFCSQAFGLHRYIAPRHIRHASIHHVSVGRTGPNHASLYHAHGRRSRLRRILWNPVFRPSHESLLRQNEEIDRLELPRIQDDAELEELKASGDLVPIVAGQTIRIDPRLDPERRYCRPWTLEFVQDLSEAYYNEFHDQIQVNSAVRTVQVQKKLRRHNRNAAPETGDTASSHLAGITVDLQRRGMTKKEIQWVEQYMLPMKNLGLLEPEEERHQWVFHVAVSGRYSDWRESKSLDADQPEEESTPSTKSLTDDPISNNLPAEMLSSDSNEFIKLY